jgi:transposase
MWALYLKCQREKHVRICQIVGISRNTLLGYIREYNDGGIARLCDLRFHGPSSKLGKHREHLSAYFKLHPPATAAQAQEEIEKETTIRLGRTQVRAFMHDLGMSFRKTAMIPAKADPSVQEEFKKNSSRDSKTHRPANARSISWTPPIL